MNIQPVSNRLYSLLVLFDMHTLYFGRAIEGISTEDAHNRLGTKANHVSWLAGSLVQQRFEIVSLLGRPDKQQAHQLFDNNKGIQDGITYPPLQTFKNEWDRTTPQLRETLTTLEDEKLDTAFEMMPGYTMPYFDFIAFCIYREAACIGQIALWRRLLGYEALKYDA